MAARLEREIKLRFDSTSASGVRVGSDREQFTIDDV